MPSPRHCVSASAPPGSSARTYCNAATVAIERYSPMSRCVPEPHPDTLPEPLVFPNSSWPAASTDSPTTGSWGSSWMERLPLSGRTGWLSDRSQGVGYRQSPVGQRDT